MQQSGRNSEDQLIDENESYLLPIQVQPVQPQYNHSVRYKNNENHIPAGVLNVNSNMSLNIRENALRSSHQVSKDSLHSNHVAN